ncbi:16S rRNA (adenine(1518)-N(6)/adenine(1519)-N(6))-dimethyltransferase RsmA [Calderihabitans maritimus]|uniref:Ribosomal RNA small subunit methyltransferase A n=1 Tax=Calderihabitans maritimus TaxID=1246530 RepID=A0A1Z5HQN9_9FIRM|nr:16S rRNA (adenine(1518)-N(6)/adenine(1519)-N(6))-dimethyltransferase RsmA [Calderihabitans maritimus]GAW91625.1 dimethyladenosine transferase [Calderihabitans maritimus]
MVMLKLASPRVTKEILNRYNFRPSKGMGQNFLIDYNIVNIILNAAELDPLDLAVEIGPGIGTMTREIASRAGYVLAIELDERLISILQNTLEECNNVEIIHADALKINFDRLMEERLGIFKSKTFKVIANLPYYITTPLIMHLLEDHERWDQAVIMIQKEVADRILACPGTKEYGALSVSVQYYAEPQFIAKVPKTVFWPRPEVDSAIVKLKRRRVPPVEVRDKLLLFRVIQGVFTYRRKTILNALQNTFSVNRQDLIKVLETSPIDPSRRGETLSLEEFAILADNLLALQEKIKKARL